MKKHISIITLAAGALLLAGNIRADESTADSAAAANAYKADQAAVQANWAVAQKQMEKARDQAAAAKQQILLAQEDMNNSVGQTISDLKQQIGDSVTVFGRPSGSAGRTLVIRSSAGDGDGETAIQGQLEEDMTVMAHILDKTIEEQGSAGNSGRRAMGIDLLFGPASAPVRNLYIDGYGALFMLNAGIPLVAPPAKVEQPKETPATDSSWESARREVYGGSGGGKMPAAAAPEYDSAKVENLKTALLASLKSASNIRNLKPDDYITICVFGPGGAGAQAIQNSFTFVTDSADGNGFGPQPPTVVTRGGARASAGTLTIRVRKSDVDAFAKGKLTPEEFQRKAALMSYAGALGGGSSAAGVRGRGALR